MYADRLKRHLESNPVIDPVAYPSWGSVAGLGVEVFTTGQVAKALRVSARCVSKWFDKGIINGYRIPESQDRRIPRESLLAFLEKYRLPVPIALQAHAPLAVCFDARDAANLPGWEIADVFTAGSLCAKRPVSVALIGDECGVSQAVAVATRILAAHPSAVVGIVVSEDAPRVIPGFVGTVYRRPVDLAAVAAALTEGK